MSSAYLELNFLYATKEYTHATIKYIERLASFKKKKQKILKSIY